MGTKKGFTLIELLVVISIIALLLSVMMPALGRARRMAQQTVCKTSLKQQGIAFLGYAQDNKDSFNEGKDGWSKARPPSHGSGFGYWWADLMPYRGTDIKTLVCAAVPKPNPNYTGYSFTLYTMAGWKNHSAVWPYAMPGLPSKGGLLLEPIPVSYTQSVWATNPADDSDISDGSVWGGWMKTPPENFWRKISSVSMPDKVPIFGDGRWLEAYPNSSPVSALTAPKLEISAERGGQSAVYDWGIGQFCVPRHPSGTDLLFADYSVRNVNLPELWTLRWHRQFDTNNKYATDPSRWLPAWVRK